jgi:dimethylargininase
MANQLGDEVLMKVVICPPSAAYFGAHDFGAHGFGARDLAAHNLQAPADRGRAQRQHAALRRALVEFGAQVIDVPELAGHPNSVFTQDVALATPDGFVRLRMGLPSRRGEPDWMAQHLAALGIPQLGRIRAPGTVEGGDVILADDVAFVGRSARTNDAGIAQLAALLEPLGYALRVADVPAPSLHIGGMLSRIGPRQMLACTDVFPADFFDGFDVVSVPKTDFISGNVIGLGAGRVIAEARNVEAVTALRPAGFVVHPLDLSEFVKGTGGPSCLILPL